MSKKFALGFSLAILAFLIGLVGYFVIIFLGNYVIDDKQLLFYSNSQMIDQEGEVISKLYVQNRELVKIKDIPQHVQDAFVAIEDERFYEHHGIDFLAIARALIKDIIAGEKLEGGSTITQQLAKNVFLSHEKTIWRKTKEVIIALNLERKYTKKQILEMYLNVIYFGHGMYGTQSASNYYFNKDTNELTVDEGAVLAALPKAPNHYSPINNIVKSRQRRNVILNKMVELGFISEEEGEKDKKKAIVLDVTPPNYESPYLTYMDMVFREAEEKYGITEDELLGGGYQVYVSMNERLQQRAYELFKKADLFPGIDDTVEGAFVLMDNDTGGIQAAIGGRNFKLKTLNRVYTKRQPGSTIKPPLVYAPALETGEYTPYSLLKNEQMSFDGYAPRNYDNVYTETITMYDAIKQSANIPAVWLLDQIGIEEGKKYLKKAGIPIKDEGLSIALGGLSDGISPVDMMKVYRAFARDGKIIEPHVITKIVDNNGDLVVEHEVREKKIYSKQTAWYMTKMLRATVVDGTAKAGSYKGALAGKTGSTNFPLVKNGTRDAWFVGYTPKYVGALWSGYDRTDEKHYLTKGSGMTASLFKQLLREMKEKPQANFVQPDGVEDLDEPIHLPIITDLTASVRFSLMGLFVNHLTWTPSKDKRVEYRIYEIKDNEEKLIGTVKGVGEYKVKFMNILSRASYYVVPYNTQTKKEGEKSNIVE
ncbi:MAG: transglycosylase domain-containing protein [Bacillaceae bacterium]